jgi:phosphoglycolate phosphatase-like HAD superfamily hydrolase
MAAPALLALDFDGVICDGLIEYFQTAWKAYLNIWPNDDPVPPAGLAERFYKLRPVIETGWEMPVLVRSLRLGQSDENILQQWSTLVEQRVEEDGLVPQDVAAQVDGSRDQWIKADLEDWLAQHRFYPGVVERLRQLLASDLHLYIITTKEERFARQLLQQEGVELSADQIFGKAVKRPKYQTLLLLMESLQLADPRALWFVEDRLKTLQLVQTQDQLRGMGLFLADWGYNIERDRAAAQDDPDLHLLTLDQFSQGFSAWM